MARKFNLKNVTKGLTTKVVPAAVGGAAALAINKVIPETIKEKVDSKIISGGKILIGAVLPEIMPGQKMLEPFAQGFIGAASAELTADLLPALSEHGAAVDGIAGDEPFEEEYLMDEYLAGADGDDVMSGAEGDDGVMSGPDDEDIV